MNHRDELAKQHGFESFAELLDISDALPKLSGETAQAYVAKHPHGHWFIWEDKPSGPASDSE